MDDALLIKIVGLSVFKMPYVAIYIELVLADHGILLVMIGFELDKS